MARIRLATTISELDLSDEVTSSDVAPPFIDLQGDLPGQSNASSVALEAKPKYVASSTRRDFPWVNTVRVEGDLPEAVKQLKEKTPKGVLVGSPMLSFALEKLGLIDEYRIVVHPVLAGHGSTLLQGLERSRHLTLVSTKTLRSGVNALHLRRKDG